MNTIRLAKQTDAANLLSIYIPYILHTAFTFEMEVPSIEDFGNRIVAYQETWPWLVCETDGIIAGYAYATKHRERAAYQWCVESSVYVDENFQHQGVAGTLYTRLFEILKYQGCRNVYAGITIPNDKSVAFHKKFGFTWLADYKNIGYKLHRWNTVSWWELQLNLYSEDPAAPVKFTAVREEFLQETLQ